MVLLLLSILTLESADSIRFLYRHFLSKLTDKSLNAFYYACSYAKVDYSRFMNATASMALKLIPKSLETQPVFLCMDDTIVPTYGKKFDSKTLAQSQKDIADLLNEIIKPVSIKQFLQRSPEQQDMPHHTKEYNQNYER